MQYKDLHKVKTSFNDAFNIDIGSKAEQVPIGELLLVSMTPPNSSKKLGRGRQSTLNTYQSKNAFEGLLTA